MELVREGVERSLRFWYIMDPWKESYKLRTEVPDYVNEALSVFFIFTVAEMAYLYMKGKPVEMSHRFGSWSAGMLSEVARLFTRMSQFFLLSYIHSNYRLINLSLDSPWTWIFAALGADLCFYWFHRMAHETTFLWAHHQTHHSSSDYNLATAIRIPLLQNVVDLMFYVPLALLVPGSYILAHRQLSLVCQFWIHASKDTIDKLPAPIEFIFNTPSHHRVHHGADRYCIDKNYGAFLIIWDRIFGTFEPERDEPITYGLVEQLETFNPVKIQLFYFEYMIKKFCSMKTWKHKFCALFYGPGWEPGKPRLGVLEEIPEKHEREVYDVAKPPWVKVYLSVHVAVTTAGLDLVYQYKEHLGLFILVILATYITLSLISFSLLLEARHLGTVSELFRCLLFVVVIYRTSLFEHSILLTAGCIVYSISVIFCAFEVCKLFPVKLKKVA